MFNLPQSVLSAGPLLAGLLALVGLSLINSCGSSGNGTPEVASPGRLGPELPYYLEIEGTPYEIGLAHGRQLKDQIHAVIGLWKDRYGRRTGTDPDSLLSLFMRRSDYVEAIRRYTPDLLEEVRGIADGAGMDFNTVLAFQYLDEVGMNCEDILHDKCTTLGLERTENRPAIVAQNMDLESLRNGFQTVLRMKKSGSDMEVMVFTCAGLIATNGLNSRGLAVCVNALAQLDYRLEGLPVAFVIRGLLDCADLDSAVRFVNGVTHATGQNYMIGTSGGVRSFECSAVSVVEYVPSGGGGAIGHTNHPFVNSDYSPKHRAALADGDPEAAHDVNSETRFATLSRMLSESAGKTDVARVQEILSSGHPEHPICSPFRDPDWGSTFGSTVMVLGEKPEMFVAPGQPDINPYRRFGFAPKSDR